MPLPYIQTNQIKSNSGDAVGPEGPAGPPGPPSNQPFDLQIFSGEYATTSVSPVRFGSRFLDLTAYPSMDTAGRTRQIEFVVDIEVGVAGIGHIHLMNRDDSEIVTGTELTTSSLINVEISSGPLTIGTAVGNLKDAKMYEVEAYHTGGAATDSVAITNARLEVVYV